MTSSATGADVKLYHLVAPPQHATIDGLARSGRIGAVCAISGVAEMEQERLAGYDPKLHGPQATQEPFAMAVVDLTVADSLAVGAACGYIIHRRRIPLLLLAAEDDTIGRIIGPVECADGGRQLVEAAPVGSDFDQAIEAFVTFPTQPGKILVLEGGDGAGKQTQTRLLRERLEGEGYPVRTLDFPHDAADYGVLIRQLLSGKHGSIREVNPLFFASLYSLNRHATLPVLQYWLKRGYNVLLDRYMEANFGHQVSKLEDAEDRKKMIESLHRYECVWLGLPPSNVVMYLDLSPEWAMTAMQHDGTRKELDMHEKAGVEYKERVRSSFLWCCENYTHWTAVPCLKNAEGSKKEEMVRASREEVHEFIYNRVRNEVVNQRK